MTAIDAIDAFFVVLLTSTQTTARAELTAGWRTSIAPLPVATPLPPRNLRVTGNT